MDKLLYVLPALACPVGMGFMMWMMMKPKKQQAPAAGGVGPDPQSAELVALREQAADLREQVRKTGDNPVTGPAVRGGEAW